MFTILVPLDGSPPAEEALPVAATIAKDLEGSIDLLLVQVKNPLDRHTTSSLVEQPRTVSEEYLQRAADRAASFGIPAQNVSYAVVGGEEVDVICGRAKQRGAQLIVMTTHGRSGLGRLVLGSVAETVLRATRTPILLVRAASAPVQAPAGIAKEHSAVGAGR